MVGSFKENILKKSNSYNYYKSEYNRLKKEKSISDNLNSNFLEVSRELKDIENEINSVSGSLSGRVDVVSGRLDELDKSVVDSFNEVNSTNQNFKEELINLKEDLSLIKKDIRNHFEFINNYLKSELSFSQKLLKEIQYSEVFKDTIIESEWLLDKSFSLNNSAANYSFFYVLYRILNEVKPLNILELGLGQTTKMTTQYASYFENSKLQVIEDNQEWINNFSSNINLSDNVKINQLNRINVLIDSTECWKYSDVTQLLKDTLFNLIIIDGPIGYSQKYPRSNIWDLVNNLADSFIIILDDYDRIGEQNTANILFKILNDNNIKFNKIVFEGIKSQLVIYSDDNYFVGWF